MHTLRFATALQWRASQPFVFTICMQAPLTMPASPFAPVRIGNIYQRFGSLESGLCENIIKASVPFLLEEGRYTYYAACPELPN